MKTEGTELVALLAASDQAGAYFADAHDREDLVEAANALQYAVVPIDLRDCDDGRLAAARIAEALRFPEWFGANWDALADCLSDLSWWPSAGYVLVLEHASQWRAQDRESFDIVLEILGETSARWAEERVPFWTFFPLPTRELEEIGE
jgi:RNAse (barnase) inhibitor barstar